MKCVICAILLSLQCFGSDLVANALKKASLEHNIDKKILYTIAKIESGFNPNIIAFTNSSKWHNISNEKISIKNIPYSKSKYLVQIKADKEILKQIALQLISQGFSVDIGLMQVNSKNISKDEIEYIFDLDYNLNKSIYIFKSCVKAKTNIKDSIECYNKGYKTPKNYNYYKKFQASFVKDFG